MGIVGSVNCIACGVTEFSEHFFFTCKTSQKLWVEAEKIILTNYGIQVEMNLHVVMTGYFNQKLKRIIVKKINNIILIGKMVVSKIKYGKFRDIITLFNEELCYRGILS